MTEVRVDHAAIREDFIGIAGRDDLTGIENDDVVREAAQELHVVLDTDERRSLGSDLREQRSETTL